jgi:acetyl-CoA carboxylase carboxyl transferase subunit beta
MFPFQKKKQYAVVRPAAEKRPEIPAGLVRRCEGCKEILYSKELEQNLNVCPKCGYHYPIGVQERLVLLIDDGSFVPFAEEFKTANPLGFPDYIQKVEGDRKKTDLNEAVAVGDATINAYPLVIGVMDSRFRMGSMGSVVGEKIAQAALRAAERGVPFILFCASGGARMQEGIFSLMQMGKTSAALQKLAQAGHLFIPVLTHPTTGGVSASFAMLGDIILAEPGALIGFAGKRVIEQTIRQKLPEDFQTAEFLLAHGQLDQIVPRHNLQKTLGLLLKMHTRKDTP